MKTNGFIYLSAFLIVTGLPSHLVGAATLDGCYLVDKTARVFTVSPGGYDPESLDHETCIEACGYRQYSFAALHAGKFCLCSDLNHDAGAKQPDESNCNSTCTGDDAADCGQEGYDLVYLLSGTQAAIQLDPSVVFVLGSAATVSTLSTAGTDLRYSYDFGDGTAPSETASHQYNAAGDYILSVTVKNDKFADFDALKVRVDSNVISGVTLTCPPSAGVSQEFECSIEVLGGKGLEVSLTFDTGAAAVTLSGLQLGDAQAISIGFVTQDPAATALPSDDIHIYGDPVFWVFPAAETPTPFSLSTIEAFITDAGDGTLTVLVYKPVCLAPSDVFCPTSNLCVDSALCNYDYTVLTHPALHDLCTAMDAFCLSEARCFDTLDIHNCPARLDRFQTDVLDQPRAEYTIVEEIPLTGLSAGYLHHELAAPIELAIGSVLGVKVTAAGAKVAYEAAEAGSPVEFQYAGTGYVAGQSLPPADLDSAHQIRHHLRASSAMPATIGGLTHAFHATGYYDISATVSSPLAPDVTEATQIRVEELVVDPTIELETDVLRTGETVTAYARIAGGVFVNYTWDWGDGNSDTTVRQATNFSEPDVMTHTYTQDGTLTITLLAVNFLNNETAEVIVYVQYPVLPEHFSVTSNSPQASPGQIGIIVTLSVPGGDFLGTACKIAISTSFYENTTALDLNANADGQSETFPHGVRFPGVYDAMVTISNHISSHSYMVIIIMVEPITWFNITAMYQPPIPGDGPMVLGHGPAQDIFPLDTPVLFVPNMATGTRVNYRVDYGDGSPQADIPSNSISHYYLLGSSCTVTVEAYNDLAPTMTDSVAVMVQANIAGVQITDLGPTASNQAKELDVAVAQLGLSSCLLVDYGDGGREIYGSRPVCENHPDHPGAPWLGALTGAPLRLSHVYAAEGSYHLRALGFNLVSDAADSLYFAVSNTACFAPQLRIRDGHPDWRGPRTVLAREPLPLQGITEVACPSVQNTKDWVAERYHPATGAPVAGTRVTLTGLPRGHRLYLADADTAEIVIPPLALPPGHWKFTYGVHMTLVGVDIHAYAVEYVAIVASPLHVQIYEGQTTAKVVGYQSLVHLKPGLLSKDPDLPADVTNQNFTSIEYYCRRFYEPWRLDDNQEISRYPKIALNVPNSDGVDDGGCYGTGNGLLDFSGDALLLNTSHFLVNMTFQVLVVVTKGSRVGNAMVTFTIKEGTIPQTSIGCGGGTLYYAADGAVAVNPTDNFRLHATCETGCDDVQYKWDLDYVSANGTILPVPNWEQYAAGTTTGSFYLSKDIFAALPGISNFIFTSHITNAQGETGKSHMSIVLNKPPLAGVCTIAPGTALSNETVTILCSGWTDTEGIDTYEFFVEGDEKTANKVVGYGKQSSVTFYSPVGKMEDDYWVTFGVEVNDVLAATTVITVGTIRVIPNTENALDYTSPENAAAVQAMLEEAVAEGNSRNLNNIILSGASQLNDIRMLADQVVNGTLNTTTTPHVVTADWHDSRIYESERTKRAFMRTELAEVLSHTSLDTIEDVLQTASTLTVLSGATDEMSHNALASLVALVRRMLDTLANLQGQVDQKTVVKVCRTIFECLTNMLQGSAATIYDPMWVLDEFQDLGVGRYATLNQMIDAEVIQTEGLSQLTTEDVVSTELHEKKEEKAKSVVSQAYLMVEEVCDLIQQNLVAGEPPTVVDTNSGQMTLGRVYADSLSDAITSVGGGQFDLASMTMCELNPSMCSGDEIIDVEASCYPTNHFNYMDSSERISEDAPVIGLAFAGSDGAPIAVVNAAHEIEIWIPRRNSEGSTCKTYEQNMNSTGQTGMSLHTFFVQFDQTVVDLEILPETYQTTQYAVLIRYLHPPTVEENDHVYILPYNISLGDGSSAYSIHLDAAYIRNNTGKYYLGIAEIPQAPQGELPNNLFNDNQSPQDLLRDLLLKEIAFNFTGNYSLCVYISGCAYFDNGTQEWSTKGVRIGPKTNKQATQCFTTHLTDFASTWIVPPTPLDFEYIFANADFAKNLSIYITTIVIYVIFFFILIWARRKDRKDIIMQGLTPMLDNKPNHKYLYEIASVTGQWKGSGTESKVFFILSGEDDETAVRSLVDTQRPILTTGSVDRFVMAVPRPLGPLNYLRLWHDNTGKGAMQNWFVQYIAVRDLQTRQRYYFLANRWFSLVDDDGQVDRLLPVASREQMKGFQHVFSSHTRKNLNDGHLWFSIFLRPAGSHFSRVQRAACCLMALWLEMLVNIMWYKVSPPAPSSSALQLGPLSMSPSQISIGIMSSLIVFPVTLLVVQIFRKARPRIKQKSHRHVIKEQQEELKKKYRVSSDDAISESHVVVEGGLANEDGLSTRSKANLLDNQGLTVKTTASRPHQDPAAGGGGGARKRRKKLTLPWWTIIFAWIVCLLATAAATLFTVFYGIQFGDETTREWLASLVVSFFTGILCTQPIKIILVALFIALIVKSPNADEDSGEEMEEDPELGKDEMWLHDTSSPADGKSAYKPLNPGNLERMREQRIKELKMYNIIREICFYVIFLWTLMVFSYGNIDSYSFFMKDQFSSTLNGDNGVNSFDKVTGVKSFWRWVDAHLVSNLYADRWYNGDLDPSQAGYFSDRQSFILGKVVLRQVRVKPRQCDVHKEFVGIIPECNEEYSMLEQDEAAYGRGWQPVNDSLDAHESFTYTESGVLDGYPFLGKHGVYSGGGYVVVLEGTQWGMRQILRRLYNATWIDKYTRAVFLEFSAYNPQVNLFGVVNFVTEFLPTGAGYPTKRVDVVRLLTYSVGFDLVRVMCEVMFYCFIVFFVVKEVRNARRERRNYLKNFWNVAECFIIAFSISSCVIYFYRMYVTNGLIEMLKAGTYAYIKLQYAAYWNEVLSYMLGFIMFLAMLKFLKLLRFNRRIGVLSSTISNCSRELLYFSIMFFVVFVAFATAFYLIFGRTVYNYSDFVYTCESLMSAMLGKFKFEELIIAEKVLGAVFFFLFMGCMTYLLINMFLTIINESFKVVNSDISKQSNEYEMVDFIIHRLKLWTGLGKPPAGPASPGDQDAPGDQADALREPDVMDEFPEKVDQLLNSIAKIYFNHDNFKEVIQGRGQAKKKNGKSSKKTITV